MFIQKMTKSTIFSRKTNPIFQAEAKSKLNLIFSGCLVKTGKNRESWSMLLFLFFFNEFCEFQLDFVFLRSRPDQEVFSAL